MEKTTLTFGLLGMTKSGKTTTTIECCSTPDHIRGIAANDDGRTKITVEYHLIAEESQRGVILESIDSDLTRFVGNSPKDAVTVFNKRLNENPILYNILGLEIVPEGGDPRAYVQEVLDSLQGSNDMKLIQQLMCTEGMDKFIRKITLRMEACSELAAMMKGKNVDLILRDTRGLLDIVLPKEPVGSTVQSPADLGLDNLDGVLFFCSDSYPNLIGELYQDLLQNVMKAVPVFLVHNRFHGIFRDFCHSGLSASDFLSMQQNENNPYAEEEPFLPTYLLLKKLGLVEERKGQGLSIKDSYFENCKLEFFLPVCSMFNQKPEMQSFFHESVCFMMNRMIIMSLDLKNTCDSLFQKDCIRRLFQELHEKNWDDLEQDFYKFDNACNAKDSTQYVKPQLQSHFAENILQDLADPKYQPLGVRGGITSRKSGSYAVPTTVVCAVTAMKWLNHIINQISDKDMNLLRDQNGNSIFGSSISDAAKPILVRKTFQNRLYKKFMDTRAYISLYSIADRNQVEEAILMAREGLEPSSRASIRNFEAFANEIVLHFINC